MKYRLFGLLTLSIGLMLAKFTILDPLAAIGHGAGAIKVYSLGALVVPLAVATGGVALLLGKRAAALMIDEDDDSPSNLGFVAVIALIACGIFLKVWLDRRIEHAGYGEPAAVQFRKDAIEVTDGSAELHAVAWANLSEIDLMAAVPQSPGTPFRFYWKFSGNDSQSVEIPYAPEQEAGVLNEIRQHVGPVQGDPVGEVKKAFVMSPGRPSYTQVVWKR
jgi:hypothetical protein